jgi:hypothetical protein
MQKFLVFSVFALAAAVAADHPALGGTLVLDPAHSLTGGSKIESETLAIDQQPESVKISATVTRTNGKTTLSEISCNTAGESCKVKDHGVVKRRMKPSGDGRTLVIEVIHLAPTQTTETLTFTRQ